MRSKLHESEAFEGETASEKRAPIWPQIVRYRKQALQVIGLLLLVSVLFVFTIPETKGKDLTH